VRPANPQVSPSLVAHSRESFPRECAFWARNSVPARRALNTVMQQDRTDRQDLDRAVLRIRLAGVALGATLLLLTPRSDQVAAGAVLLGYTAAILVQRFARDRLSAWSAVLPVIGVGLDVLYATGISLLLPLTAGTWALYAFAIGTAAIGFGAMGAAAATAASILAYDVALALRAEDLRPSDLWPVQLLLAIGLLV